MMSTRLAGEPMRDSAEIRPPRTSGTTMAAAKLADPNTAATLAKLFMSGTSSRQKGNRRHAGLPRRAGHGSAGPPLRRPAKTLFPSDRSRFRRIADFAHALLRFYSALLNA